MQVGQAVDTGKERPAYVRFEKRAIEDRAASLVAGNMVTKDEDYAIITPVGSKDEIPRSVKDWLAQLKEQSQQGRIPPTFLPHYTGIYEAWKRGEELPVNGTPIKGCHFLTPAQQANCIAANVRTVEDLAAANGEAVGRLGMQGYELKNRATTWLAAAKDTGVVVQLNIALRAENDTLKETVAGLNKRNAELVAALEAAKVKA